jgi:hypothetical protein
MTIYALSAAPRGFEDVALFGEASVPFVQNWSEHPSKALRGGRVRFGWRPDALWVLAEMEGEGRTIAQRNNEELWLLGDVFELFLARATEPDYLELHAAPNGVTLQLRFPDAAAVHALRADLGESATQLYVVDCGWRPQICNSHQGWQVLAHVPMALEAGTQLQLACGRYDYGSGEAVISNTAPLHKPNFHRRADWHNAVLSA